MALKRFRYRKSDGALTLEGVGRIDGRTSLYPFYDSLDKLGEGSLSSLVKAAQQYLANEGAEHLNLRWSTYGKGEFDARVTPPNVSRIATDGESIWTVARMSVYGPPTLPVLKELVKSNCERALSRHAARIGEVRVDVGHPTRSTDVEVHFELPNRGRSISDAALAADDARDAIYSAGHGASSPLPALEALLRGQPGMLIGQPESGWLEAKSAPYRLDTESRKLEFAKDVASFANSGEGGLIVLGLETKNKGKGDIVKRVRLFDLDLMDVERYHQILGSHLYPGVDGLEIRQFPIQGRKGYAFIRVPTQPAELKPILVIGHATSGRILTHHVSIPMRRDAVTTYRDAGSIHSLLLAGRVALAAAEGRDF